MGYLFTHYTWYFCILFIKINFSLTNHVRFKKSDVDVVVDKLLSSDKFEKLVERVAVKAAEKISIIKDEIFKTQNNKLNETHQSEFRNQQDSDINNLDKIESKNGFIRIKVEDTRKDSIMPLNDLSLKYISLTKSKLETPSDNDDDLDENGDSTDADNKQKGNKKYDENNDTVSSEKTGNSFISNTDKNKSKLYFSSENVNYESNEYSEESERNQKKERTKLKQSINKDENSDTGIDNTEVNNRSGETQSQISLSDEENHDDTLNKAISIENKTSVKTKENENASEDKKHLEPINSLNKHNQSDKESYETDLREKGKTTASGAKMGTSLDKTIIRREGDKLYTYEKSQDYAEYHEQLKNMKKINKLT